MEITIKLEDKTVSIIDNSEDVGRKWPDIIGTCMSIIASHGFVVPTDQYLYYDGVTLFRISKSVSDYIKNTEWENQKD